MSATATPPAPPTCARCTHFRRHATQLGIGICKCNPPQIVAFPQPGGAVALQSMYPPTVPDECCGQFEAAPQDRTEERTEDRTRADRGKTEALVPFPSTKKGRS